MITHGFSGSGKTTVSQTLLETLGAVRLRSDVQRKRLFGATPAGTGASGVAAGRYSPAATRATYLRLADLARTIVTSGRIALVDATCLSRWQRDRFRELAASLRVAFAIVDCVAPEALLRQRIEARRGVGIDPSEADAAVLAAQLAGADPLGDDEAPLTLRVDATATDAAAIAALCGRLLDHCADAPPR